MLDLVTGAANHNSRLYFCSSLASVLARPPPSNVIYETPTDDPATASPIGYSQSKWATEKLCRLANESALKGRVSILRVGQLCGDTKTGYWNEKEGWPLMIKTAQITGCLPLLDEVSPAEQVLTAAG
jgi:thioester reductase-like protein